MNQFSEIHRRRFLRGMGVCLALPAFESFLPAVLATDSQPTRNKGANQNAPVRTAFLYVPNGVNVERWRPKKDGQDYELSPTLSALEPHKSEFQVVGNLEQKNGWAGPDGAGDHARATATILTSARPKKTAGSDIHLGISVDQLAAKHLGGNTRFPSLELSCDGVRNSGGCDSGYSCAYQFNLAWRSETQPVAPESNPRLVFERLFGVGDKAERQANMKRRQDEQRSVLDFIQEDAKKLGKQLGRNDQNKLSEYLTGVREIEQRLERAEKFGPLPDPGMSAPNGIPRSYSEHIRLMFDMLVLAFRTDSTRIATFMLAHDGSNRTFEEIGVTDGHHALSHHQSDAKKLEKIAKIDQYYIDQFAYFLGKLRDVKDVDGKTLLDNSMIVYASGLADGNRHAHDNLPVILAGRGGGALNPGKHLKLAEKTPMSNLYVKMLNVMGAKVETFGDSTGRIDSV